MVTLYSPSLSPTQIRKVFKTLPVRNDFFYRMYVRGESAEVTALEKAFRGSDHNPRLFEPFIGVEFPSERMNKIIGKGIDINVHRT